MILYARDARHVTFRGYPPRAYDLSESVKGERHRNLLYFLYFQIRQVRNGRVSQDIGVMITTGHRVKIRGPFRFAYLRDILKIGLFS